MQIVQNGADTVITGPEHFSLSQTLDCGQAFRWSRLEDGSWHGIACGKYLRLKHEQDKFILFDTSVRDFEDTWRSYFDLDRDYASIIKTISSDGTLARAADFAGGIRILRQEPWEALCSFIISANNNIPRIKGIIGRLCEGFGDEVQNGLYTFPSAERIAGLHTDELSVLRCGFRAKYILDAAQKVASGEILLNELQTADTDSARRKLMTIYGVGEKVADCTLLFGLGHLDAFPKDVWIKRAMEQLFGGALPECALPYAGIAQQYLFHFARMTKLAL